MKMKHGIPFRCRKDKAELRRILLIVKRMEKKRNSVCTPLHIQQAMNDGDYEEDKSIRLSLSSRKERVGMRRKRKKQDNLSKNSGEATWQVGTG